jgi:glycosyltransferase involved in cell wall biosynthesis
MKVLIAARAYPPDVIGGGEVSTRLLAISLVEAGFDVVVMTIGRKASEEKADGVRIIRRPAPNIYWSIDSGKIPLTIKALWHLRDSWIPSIDDLKRVVEYEKPDIVHTSTVEDISTALWSHCAQSKIPVVHTLRSYSILCPKATMFRKARNCDRICLLCNAVSWPKRARTQCVSGVIGISRFILEKHLHAGCFPGAKTIVIPNPVADGWGHCKQPRAACNPRSSPHLTIGFLGRLTTEKGLEILLSAMRDCRRADIELRVAGTGHPHYVDRLKHQALGLNVEWRQEWADAQKFLQELDALVVPSLWQEPFGRVVAESFAVGLPVICSSRGGLSELVQHGQNGFIFDPQEPWSLAAILKQLDISTLQRMTDCCLQSAQAMVSKLTARQHGEFYAEVLSHSLFPISIDSRNNA